MAITYEPINTYTATSDVAVVNFASIPATYDDLLLVIQIKSVSGGNDLYMRFNDNSGNAYYRQIFYGYASTPTGQRQLASTHFQMAFAQNGTQIGKTSQIISHIGGYCNSNIATSVITRGNSSSSATDNNYEVGVSSQIYNSTATINKISIAGNGDWTSAHIGAGSVLTLFGIKGA